MRITVWIRRLGRIVLRGILLVFRETLGRLILVDERLVLFGSGMPGFSDNARYLFEYVSAKKPTFQSIWVGGRMDDVREIRRQGFNALWKYSPRAFIAAIRARYFFVTHGIDDIFPVKGRKTMVVNLWHGSPLKKSGYDSEVDLKWIRRRKRLGLSLPYEQWDAIIISHEIFAPIFKSAMRVTDDKLLPLGLPRNDLLMMVRKDPDEGESIKREVLRQVGVEHPARILLYAPTFRDSSLARHIGSFLNSESVQKVLVDGNMLMLCRFHPLSVEAQRGNAFTGNVKDASGLKDVQRLLVAADGLVSDYSSIIFDYLILGRPTLLYLADVKDYEKDRGGFYFDLRSLPFDRAINDNELLNWLSTFSRGTARGAAGEYFNYHVDGEASQRIADYFLR